MKINFSIITPTFNSEKYIYKVLDSLANQDEINFEVLIIDAGSEDKTIEICEKFKKKIKISFYDNKVGDSETAKFIGIENSKGKFIVLLDSDNIIQSNKWLSSALNIFNEYENVVCIETPWLINKNDSIYNQYFSLMQIGDPFVKYFSPKYMSSYLIKETNEYKIIKHNEKSPPVTSSGNGVFYKKNSLNRSINKKNKFEESNYSSFLISEGHLFAMLKSPISTHHIYTENFTDFLKKRKRTAIKFFLRKKEGQTTWVDKIGIFWSFLVTLYSISIIGPAIESLIQIFRTKNKSWIIHPLALFLTTVIYIYYYFKFIVLKININRKTEHH